MIDKPDKNDLEIVPFDIINYVDHDLVRDKNHKEFHNSLVKHIRIKMIDNVELDPNLCT